MISYSSSFLFRTKCKYCLREPSNIRIYSGVHLGVDDPVKEARSYCNEVYNIEIDIVDAYLKYLRKQSLSMHHINYLPMTSVEVRSFRKNKSKNNKSNLKPKICLCKCGKSYWLSFAVDKEIYPEQNRKSSKLYSKGKQNVKKRK